MTHGRQWPRPDRRICRRSLGFAEVITTTAVVVDATDSPYEFPGSDHDDGCRNCCLRIRRLQTHRSDRLCEGDLDRLASDSRAIPSPPTAI